MLAFFDAAVILVLLAVGVIALPAEALVPAVWCALSTPMLIRTDLRERRLPNSLTVSALALVVATAVHRVVVPSPNVHPEWGLVVLIGVGAAGIALALRGGFGMGDVKLAAALAASIALSDPSQLSWFGALTSIAALAAALRRLGARSLVRLDGRSRTIAFGPCLLVGYWATLGLVTLGEAA